MQAFNALNAKMDEKFDKISAIDPIEAMPAPRKSSMLSTQAFTGFGLENYGSNPHPTKNVLMTQRSLGHDPNSIPKRSQPFAIQPKPMGNVDFTSDFARKKKQAPLQGLSMMPGL